MKFVVVNKSTTKNRFVLHTLQGNITHLAVITRKTNIKLGILKGGNWKKAAIFILFFFYFLFMQRFAICDSQLKLITPNSKLLLFIFLFRN